MSVIEVSFFSFEKEKPWYGNARRGRPRQPGMTEKKLQRFRQNLRFNLPDAESPESKDENGVTERKLQRFTQNSSLSDSESSGSKESSLSEESKYLRRKIKYQNWFCFYCETRAHPLEGDECPDFFYGYE